MIKSYIDKTDPKDEWNWVEFWNKWLQWNLITITAIINAQTDWSKFVENVLENQEEQEKHIEVNRRVRGAIEKWKKYALSINNEVLYNKLTSLEVIDGKVKLSDWTIIITWYPDIESDPKKWIFTRNVKNLQSEDIKAVYFTYEKWLKDYCESKWYKIPTDEEYVKIFNEISEEWDDKFTSIIIDVLWRAFSGFYNDNWGFTPQWNSEQIWSGSPSDNMDNANYYFLNRGHRFANTVSCNKKHALGVIFVDDNKAD